MNTIPIGNKTIIPKYKDKDPHGFYTELRSRVDLYFKLSGLSKKGGREIAIKTALLLITYLVSYGLMLCHFSSLMINLVFAIVFGLTNVLIVFNIAHDAAHHALFHNDRLNRLFSFSFNLVGANAYLWNITHNQIHHGFPNVGDYDGDIHQQSPFIRVSPTVQKKAYHRFQPYYAILLYMVYSIFLLFQKDYQDLGILPKKDSRMLLHKNHPVKEYFIFLAGKVTYYTVTILIPFLVIQVSPGLFLIGFLIVHFFMSLLLAVVLIPVHMVDEAPFAVVKDYQIEDSWVIHVLRNTTDYSQKNRLANWLFGGLNTHLVHHLFPGICHVHYISLSSIVQQTAKEYGYEYRSVSMGEAIASHYRLLKRMSR